MAENQSASNARPNCHGEKTDGTVCKARRVSGSQYCFFHDPERQADRAAAQRAGGQKNRPTVLARTTPDAPLRSAQDALDLLAATINQVRRGEVDAKVANTVGYLVGLFLKASHETEIEQRLVKVEAVTLKAPQPVQSNDEDEEDEEWIAPLKQNGKHREAI